jgi:hypothetical protein
MVIEAPTAMIVEIAKIIGRAGSIPLFDTESVENMHSISARSNWYCCKT